MWCDICVITPQKLHKFFFPPFLFFNQQVRLTWQM